jgi:predicted aspartyl protease
MRIGLILRGAAAAVSLLALQASLGAQTTQSAPPAATTLPVPATAAGGETAEEAAANVLIFGQDTGNRMTVPVNVDGEGPFPFLVDTGAERTVISRELARKLDLGPGRRVRMHTMTEVSDVTTALIPELIFSKRTMTDIHAPALEAQHLGAAGMLGVDTLQAQRVTFDFAKKTMTIVPSKKREQKWDPDTIVIMGRSLYGRLVLMDAEIEGQKIVVVLDTGSQISIGNEALRRKLKAKKRLSATFPVQLTSVTGGRLTADYTVVRKIRIGGVAIENMPIAFAEVHPFKQLQLTDRPAFLLGMDALQLFDRVSVDFARKEVRLLPGDDTSHLNNVGMARIGKEVQPVPRKS